MRAWLSALLLAAALPTMAAELRSVDVKHKDGIYTMRSEVYFDAAPAQVYAVFATWDYSTSFSSAIVEAYDTDEDGRPGYYSRFEGCVLFFCRSLERRGYVLREPISVVRASVDPERSDFHRSDEVWALAPEGSGTTVIYSLTMQPKFWVPPGIGPFFIKRKLKKSGGAAIDRIEEIAQGLPRA